MAAICRRVVSRAVAGVGAGDRAGAATGHRSTAARLRVAEGTVRPAAVRARAEAVDGRGGRSRRRAPQAAASPPAGRPRGTHRASAAGRRGGRRSGRRAAGLRRGRGRIEGLQPRHRGDWRLPRRGRAQPGAIRRRRSRCTNRKRRSRRSWIRTRARTSSSRSARRASTLEEGLHDVHGASRRAADESGEDARRVRQGEHPAQSRAAVDRSPARHARISSVARTVSPTPAFRWRG